MDVKVTYNGSNRIVIKGDGLHAVLMIELSELGKIYAGEEGKAKLTLDTLHESKE